MQRQKKIYIVQALLDLQFAVVASDDDGAKKEAHKLVQKALDTGVLGSVGWTLELMKIHEVKPISR
jgi:predicted dinucleotide-binding enzyme